MAPTMALKHDGPYSNFVEVSGPGKLFGKKGRAKAMKRVYPGNFDWTDSEEKMQEVRMNIIVKKKYLDGEEIVTYKVTHDVYSEDGYKMEEKEYTDINAFVNDCLAIKVAEATGVVE